MLKTNRYLLAGTALAFAVGLTVPATLLAQQSNTTAPPASSTSQPAMNNAQTGVPSSSGAQGSAQDATPGSNTAQGTSPGTTSGTTGSSSGTQMQTGQSSMAGDQVAAMGEKLEGKDLYGADNQKVGEIDKVVMGPDNKANSVLVDIGGFLGIGAKTVSIPVSQLRADGDRVVAQNLTKEQARAMEEYKETGDKPAQKRM